MALAIQWQTMAVPSEGRFNTITLLDKKLAKIVIFSRNFCSIAFVKILDYSNLKHMRKLICITLSVLETIIICFKYIKLEK